MRRQVQSVANQNVGPDYDTLYRAEQSVECLPALKHCDIGGQPRLIQAIRWFSTHAAGLASTA
jgi:hypothetical protein